MPLLGCGFGFFRIHLCNHFSLLYKEFEGDSRGGSGRSEGGRSLPEVRTSNDDTLRRRQVDETEEKYDEFDNNGDRGDDEATISRHIDRSNVDHASLSSSLSLSSSSYRTVSSRRKRKGRMTTATSATGGGNVHDHVDENYHVGVNNDVVVVTGEEAVSIFLAAYWDLRRGE